MQNDKTKVGYLHLISIISTKTYIVYIITTRHGSKNINKSIISGSIARNRQCYVSIVMSVEGYTTYCKIHVWTSYIQLLITAGMLNGRFLILIHM